MISPTTTAQSVIKTTCPYCGVGCGVLATIDAQTRTVAIQGDPDHPANFGRLCSKGSALGETVSTEGRLLYPKIGGERVSWDTALDTVAQTFTQTMEQYGRESIMFYVSGQLLTEDYYVANKLIKGFIGNNNIDSNSRLCMSSAVAGHKRAFGSDTVPVTYEDIEQCDLFVLVGSNLAWCHPVLFQRLKAAQLKDGKKVVVIDPRATDSCAIADLHLPIRPGSDTALFNGLLHYLYSRGYHHAGFLAHVDGLGKTLQVASGYSVDTVAKICDVDAVLIEQFYQLYAQTDKVVSAFSMGVNQSSRGTDKVNSIINCHLLTGRIGKVGAGPFSITGQPNAMGGREVGALSNLLASHFELLREDHRAQVAQFWQTPVAISDKPGLTATQAAQAILDGKIKTIWIMATNPVVSLTEASLMRAALRYCNHVIVSDCIAQTDTGQYADIHLPAQGWSEKSGTVTNSERRISRQRQLFPPLGEAKPDWWIISQVAQRMDFSGFNYQAPADIFDEYAKLSVFNNEGQRSLFLGALSQLSAQQYDELAPIQWPVASDQLVNVKARFFANGAAYGDSGRLNMIPIEVMGPQSQTNDAYPLILNTGRIRDQWHTMTRTGLAARLNQHLPEPFLQIHPCDIARYALSDGGLATVKSTKGQVKLRVKADTAMREGEVFASMHWSINSSNANIGALITSHIDPFSKQPEFKYTPVCAEPLAVGMHGFILVRGRSDLAAYNKAYTGAADYWVMNRLSQALRFDVAFSQVLNQQQLIQQFECLGSIQTSHSWIVYQDEGTQTYRFAQIARHEDGSSRLELVAYFGPAHESLPEATWLASCFEETALSALVRKGLLIGRPAEGYVDIGRIVCSCFSVGENTITQAIVEQKLTTTAQIGQCLRAGTNCGSCVPELKRILTHVHASAAKAS